MTDTTPSTICPLPPVRRVVTGHTPAGDAKILRDEVQPPQYWPGSPKVNGFYSLGRTETVPVSNDSELGESGEWVDEIAVNGSHVSEKGSVFRVFDFSPGTIVVCSCYSTCPFAWLINCSRPTEPSPLTTPSLLTERSSSFLIMMSASRSR